ncbi:MAG: DUF429 domain-containing protein [Planctomycetota bacterium]
MAATIVGVDCAVQPTKVGLALAEIDNNSVRVLDTRKCGASQLPIDVIFQWHIQTPISLLALDAPLGWPAAMADSLSDHQAGGSVEAEPNALFRRATDIEIHRRLKKQPLDVGANFIARTAKAALDLIAQLRHLTAEPIPLAWTAEIPSMTSAIEVYPAATLRVHGLPLVRYKETAQREARQQMLHALPHWFDASAGREAAIESADTLDAILCLLAAADFCRGRAIPPADQPTAQKEGWIWA